MNDKYDYWWEPIRKQNDQMKSELETMRLNLGEIKKQIKTIIEKAEEAAKTAEEASKMAYLTRNAIYLILDFLMSRSNDDDKAILQAISLILDE
jgi:methyl-accepting chemotaxis protein